MNLTLSILFVYGNSTINYPFQTSSIKNETVTVSYYRIAIIHCHFSFRQNLNQKAQYPGS
jgi:hypothetical protein